MRTWNPLALAALAALAACVPTEAEVNPDLTGDQPVTGDIEIDVVGRSALIQPAYAEPENHELVGNTAFDSYLYLGLGADYPDHITMEVGEVWQSRCALEGTWTADRIVDSGDASVVEVALEGDAFALDLKGIGETEIVVHGTFDGGCTWWSDAIGVWDVEFTLYVNVVEPVSAVLESQPYSCANTEEPLAVLGGALNDGFAVRAVDRTGKAYTLDNAERTRQVAYAMRLPDGASATLPPVEDGLTGMVFEGAAGEVELVGASGRFATLDLAAPEDVDELEMVFVVPMGDNGQDYVLGTDPGVVWADLFVFEDVRRVVPAAGVAIVDGRQACTSVDPEWFTASVTPDEPALTELSYMGSRRRPVGYGWEILGYGSHTFTMQAPALNGGAGLTHEVEVIFR